MHLVFWLLSEETHLLKVIAGVNPRLDVPLPVELHQLGQSASDELLIRQKAQVESTDGFVGLHQLQRSEGELVVPGLG